MGEIKVLVVDDSSVARELIGAILSTDKEIVIAGHAANGREAIEKVRNLKPDIVTMDIEMPVLDGLAAIEQIMASTAVPILAVTTRADAHTAYAAISKGALDLVVKPDINLEDAPDFIEKIKLLSKIKVITHIGGKRAGAKAKKDFKKEEKRITEPAMADRIVAIASSTGGPEALSVILSGLPEKLPCPIVVAQHISDGFVTGMAAWLNRISKLDVKVAVEGEKLVGGSVYISPSEKHMEIDRRLRISLVERSPRDIFRPSCDMLLASVALRYGEKSTGVILTGIGSDGVTGMQKIREAGGTTIAQDEETSIVFGMPKVAIESGCIQQVLPLAAICNGIVSAMRDKDYAGS